MTTEPAASAVPRHPLRARIGRIVFLVIALVVVMAVAAAFTVTWTIHRSFPQTAGELTLDGLDGTVSVQRDDLGIPTITAESTHDLFFAQGFTHAQDRFFEMDFRRHVTAGRVAEMFGASQAATDAFLRTLGWRAVAEQEVEALDDTTRGYYQAYADGVNAYLSSRSGADLSLEYAVLGIQNPEYEPEPWEPADSVAWLKAMAWDLRTNIEDETARALLAADLQQQTGDPAAVNAQLETMYPGYPFADNPVIVPKISSLPASGTDAAPAAATTGESQASDALMTVEWQQASDVIEAASLLLGSPGEGIGSNSWVVSGDLTESGKPLLANDPHLGASLPSVWYQVQLKCATVTAQCPFDVGGFSFSGLPGVVIGHNERIAWGFTNLTTDVTDLYIERVQGDSYWRDGALVPLEVSTETIEVAGGDDIELTIRRTVHGPLISDLTPDMTAIADGPAVTDGSAGATSLADDGMPDAEYAVSLRWTALDPGTTASAVFAMATAQDFEDFRRAAALFDVPAQNLIYADVDGNIGYQTPGRLPVRGAGDGWLPQPGWDSAYDWTGFIPFEELPVSYNPASGYIVTANNAIVDDQYAHFLSRDWDHGYRANRIAHLLERRAAAAPLTAQDMRDIQADEEMWIGKRLAMAMEGVTVTGKGPKAAVDLLRTWDAQNDADSPAAAYANALWAHLARNLFTEREVPLPVDDQGRLFTVVAALLDDPTHPLWTNERIDVDGMEEMLSRSAEDAYRQLRELQGEDVRLWRWGSLHALQLRSETLGSSGIAPIEALFNRGPFPVGGGGSVVNATGWSLGSGSYATETVPSMRMVVDLANFDASSWNQLTGQSGHAFHQHYTDQTADWAAGVQRPWPFTAKAVTRAAVDTLVLRPAG
ncbi:MULTISPECIES: penicillin acylase family protein [Microbacterium]|uniref:penicillin acylase family protein n=1 Tax=Microbacterium TaxID=33882 RepID=UPI00217D9FC8|nr:MULTISPECIES: penicillin acylase family protein [Microbacterium]UWF77575.1 penicillin acylase family protein [Microbacterium neungamense]WCM55746.1 penicillin acylase family protein [Microbacterium sp. EF45047]